MSYNCFVLNAADTTRALVLEKLLVKASQPPGRTNIFLSGSEGRAIRAINEALGQAIEDETDIVILDGRYEFSPDTVSGLSEAVATDPMIICAGARSSNSPITGFPRPLLTEGREACFFAFAKVKPYFSVRSYVPLLTPSCVMLRTSFLKEIGRLDEAYRYWENALDDLLMRANRYGFRSVLANHAYAYNAYPHMAPDCHEDNIRLHARYPELDIALPEYFDSTEYRTEELVAAATRQRPLIAFDFSYFSTSHDGTNEAGLRILKAAHMSWENYDLAVIAKPEVWDAFNLGFLSGLARIGLEDRTSTAAAVIRIGQPWTGEELFRLFNLAPVVGIFMLDSIGYDCLYNAVHAKNLHAIWSFACEFADIIFAQSEFTAKRLHERFTFGQYCLTSVSRHSLDLAEYCTRTSMEQRYILVIGNMFHHKFVTKTVDALAPAFPEKKIMVIGAEQSVYPNVTAHPSGGFDEETFSKLYLDAECVVFPSVYEGFGFPILHSLARGKVVYVRDSELNVELAPLIRHGNNIRLYKDTAQLVVMLKTARHVFSPDDRKSGETGGWQRSAGEIKAALKQKTDDMDAARIAARLRWCKAVFRNFGN